MREHAFLRPTTSVCPFCVLGHRPPLSRDLGPAANAWPFTPAASASCPRWVGGGGLSEAFDRVLPAVVFDRSLANLAESSLGVGKSRGLAAPAERLLAASERCLQSRQLSCVRRPGGVVPHTSDRGAASGTQTSGRLLDSFSQARSGRQWLWPRAGPRTCLAAQPALFPLKHAHSWWATPLTPSPLFFQPQIPPTTGNVARTCAAKPTPEPAPDLSPWASLIDDRPSSKRAGSRTIWPSVSLQCPRRPCRPSSWSAPDGVGR